MPEEFMGCSRECNGDGWDDHITVTMYNMGQYNECHYSQCLTIKDATKLRDQLTALIEKNKENPIIVAKEY